MKLSATMHSLKTVFIRIRAFSWDLVFPVSAINREILRREREIHIKLQDPQYKVINNFFDAPTARREIEILGTRRNFLRDKRKDRLNSVTLVATIITAIATGVLAYYSYTANSDTLLLLNEQRTNTEIQYRAYLAITDNEIIPNYLSNDPTKPLVIRDDIENSGLTPASNFNYTFTLFVSGQKPEELSTGQGPIVDPGQTIYSELQVGYPLIQEISTDSNNYLRVQITYNDYSNTLHSYTSDLQIQFTSTSTGDVAPSIKDNYEDNIAT